MGHTLAPAEVVEEIRFVFHPSFTSREDAAQWRGAWPETADEQEFAAGHMPDETTRACARRMHYAAHRAERARRPAEVQLWRRRYFALRDRIILGNRKLVFGAVRKRLYQSQAADDLIGECYLVMIKAVAAYNPWIGIRFSTYAFTCLMRALSRLGQRSLADKLSRYLSLDQLGSDGPVETPDDAPTADGGPRVEEFLRDDHPLLTPREKTVIRRRFQLSDGSPTLENVGRDLGLSKERVRQVQAIALDKIRQALMSA